MKSALDVHRALLGADVLHEMIRLRTPALTGDDLPRSLGVDPDACVVVRCYVATCPDGDRFVAVLLRAGATADPVSLLDALDADAVRPATGDEINIATEYASSLVSPVALPAAVLLLADAALGTHDVLYAPTGESGVALGIRTRDLLVATGARATALTARPLGAGDQVGWDRATPLGQVLDLTAGRLARATTKATRTTG